MTASDAAFAGSIPAIYDRYLGPLLFDAYAEAVAERVAALRPARILETAAGTGIVTMALNRALPDAEIVATDLNPAMLEVAAGRGLSPRVQLQPADAQSLPFDDSSFDLVVCQFGVMFYPDKVAANREARRVLRDGGRYLAVIWDRLERNPASLRIHQSVAELFPDDPPRFLERTPFGYYDPVRIERDLHDAGFGSVEIETVAAESRPVDAREAAIGLCQGSPLRVEIEAHGPDALDRATAAAERSLRELGAESIRSPLSALFVTATR